MSDKIVRITDIMSPVSADFAERVTREVNVGEEYIPPSEKMGIVGEGRERMSLADTTQAQGAFLSSADVARYANAPTVRPQPTRKKPWAVSISAMVPPRQTVTTTQVMQLSFKAKQMMCAVEGGRLYIRSVFVGQRVQLMQWNETGMRVDFLKDKIDVDFDVCDPGLYITVQLENRGDEPADFDMTLFGEATQ